MAHFSPLCQIQSPILSHWDVVSAWAEGWVFPAATHFLLWTKKSNRKLLLHHVSDAMKILVTTLGENKSVKNTRYTSLRDKNKDLEKGC